MYLTESKVSKLVCIDFEIKARKHYKLQVPNKIKAKACRLKHDRTRLFSVLILNKSTRTVLCFAVFCNWHLLHQIAACHEDHNGNKEDHSLLMCHPW